MRLTHRTVEALTYTRKSGAQCAWDSQLAGFGVRVYPTGRKAYVVSYRVDGRQRFQTLGRVGPLTLHEARNRALEVLAAAGRGQDPSGERIARRKAPTMADLRDRYLRDHSRPRKKPRSIDADVRIWRCHILPRLGRKKVADVTRADLFSLHAAMSATPYQANRTLAVLSKAFNLCEIWGWRQDGSNPCRHVPRFHEERRERFLSSDEIQRLTETLAEVKATRLEEAPALAAIRLLMLTGCRVGEIKTLRWSEVDFERRCLRLTDSKTGRRTVYLNGGALQLLADLERVPDNPYVIVGDVPGQHLIGLTRVWYRIRKRAGLHDLRLHDLRHTFASVGAGLGLSLPMIGKLLGHRVAATTERYAHLAADPIREAAERVGSEISAAMSGRPPAEVHPFERQRWPARVGENG